MPAGPQAEQGAASPGTQEVPVLPVGIGDIEPPGRIVVRRGGQRRLQGILKDYQFCFLSGTGWYRDLIAVGREYGARWYTAGARSKRGHPHHPLYLRKDSPLEDFDAAAYCDGLFAAL